MIIAAQVAEHVACQHGCQRWSSVVEPMLAAVGNLGFKGGDKVIGVRVEIERFAVHELGRECINLVANPVETGCTQNTNCPLGSSCETQLAVLFQVVIDVRKSARG